MTRSRPPKKTESLELRLPHQTKAAFMAHCRRGGSSASEAVRRFIEAELAGGVPRRPGLWRLAAAAAAGLALGTVAAPSLARSDTASREAFDRRDVNQDGALSFQEFRGFSGSGAGTGPA
jgi:hypothetical protein